jgi:hypothetical protein
MLLALNLSLDHPSCPQLSRFICSMRIPSVSTLLLRTCVRSRIFPSLKSSSDCPITY